MNLTLIEILASISIVLALLFGTYSIGRKVERESNDAALIKAQALVNEYRSNADISAKMLAEEKAKVAIQTEKVYVRIPQVTTGKPCLNSSTARLLNSDIAGVSEAPREPIGKTPAPTPFVTDTQTANWIAGAVEQYKSCYAQLNKLIDFEVGNKF